MTDNPYKIDVLDLGHVHLVNYMGDDASVAASARVSYNKDESSWGYEKNAKLLSYLYKNKHSSPFEHVVMTFHVKAPIFVLRQWQRHRTWSYNELSYRYTKAEQEFYIPDIKTIGVQSKKNKQMRELDPLIPYTDEESLYRYVQSCKSSVDIYEKLLDAGWPREIARSCLPQSMYTRMYATVDLHNLLHFIKLRDKPDAQWEIQQYAKALKKLASEVAPVTMEIADG